jgi:hypothetical protein
LNLEISKDFLYTMAFNTEKYAALMKRPKKALSVDMNTLTAGIDIRIWGVLFGIFALLFSLSWLNERFQHSGDRNSVWCLLLSLFPSNGHMFSHQSGATRKFLMTTSGFAVMIFSSLYQAKLSEQLLVPQRQPEFTTKDIENMVSSGTAKLLFSSESSFNLQYI